MTKHVEKSLLKNTWAVIFEGSSLDGLIDSSFLFSSSFIVSFELSKATVSSFFGVDEFVIRTVEDLGHFIPRGFDCFSSELTKNTIYFLIIQKY